MNEHLRRALEALQSGAGEVRGASIESTGELRARLRRTAEEVLAHLEAEERAEPEPEDIFSTLDRQSRDIAEDLRRADRLMRERLGRE